jgi:hypothetical protein
MGGTLVIRLDRMSTSMEDWMIVTRTLKGATS